MPEGLKERRYHGSTPILRGSFTEYVSSRLGEPVRRHFLGDALSDPTNFPHADLEGQRYRGRAGGRRRRGDAKHRPRLFRLAVRQVAKTKTHRARWLPIGRCRQTVDGRCHRLARRAGRTILGPARHWHSFCTARRTYRFFGERSEQRTGLRTRRGRRQCRCFPGPIACRPAAHRVASRHTFNLLPCGCSRPSRFLDGPSGRGATSSGDSESED